MGKYCLIKHLSDEFKSRLKSGEINPEKLSDMTSQERHEYFKGFLGEENAANVNALFEKKLLQKNKWNAYLKWAKEVTGITPEVRRDLISRIEKMSKSPSLLSPEGEQVFMNDLVNSKLGFGVTEEESRKITELTNKMTEFKSKADPKTFTFPTEKDRLDYGLARVVMQDYVSNLKLQAKQPQGLKETLKHYANPVNLVETLAGTLKSIVASMDNSFFGRQGIKVLYTRPNIWMKNFGKSFGDIGRELAGIDAMAPIKADIYSRPNALNGKYNKWGLDIGINTEEAFPSALPEKIPLFKRLYKASESAYNGAALRMRADLADRLDTIATKNGVDLMSDKEAKAFGKLINSTTGRGSLGKAEALGKEINVLLFSGKFLKANIDTLFGGAKNIIKYPFARKSMTFAEKESAKNLIRIAGSVAAVLGIADRLWPGSVDWDSRSSDFGKIKIGDTRFDVTGGMGSLVTLASRIVPTQHDGKWGFWKKSGDKYTQLGTGKFGTSSPIDILSDFAQGKLSPTAGLLRDRWEGKMFGGKPLTVQNQAEGSLEPMIYQTYKELKENPNSAGVWRGVLADAFGISVNTYSQQKTDWNQSDSKELNQFKEMIGQDKFNQANEEYNKLVEEKIKKVQNDERYKKMSDEDKQKILTKAKDIVKQSIFDKYHFTYKQEKTDTKNKKDIESIVK